MPHGALLRRGVRNAGLETRAQEAVQGLSHVGAVQEVRQQDEERGVLFLLRGGVLRTQVHEVEEALAGVCASDRGVQAGLMDVLLRAAGSFRRVPCSGASLA